MDGRLLLVEDDASVRETATLVLERAGHRVIPAADGVQALQLLATERFDLVVLDLMLPGIDGFEVCRRMRRVSGVPIIMLTARSAAGDVVTGLALGADDYVTKPYDAAVLVARVHAVLRRVSAVADHGPSDRIELGELEIDLLGMRVSLRGDPVPLTAIEYRLLAELAGDVGEVKSRETLLEKVWGYDYLGDSRLVDMAIKRLRDKLDDDPRQPTYITTVRGFGYRFERQP